jgi:nitrile hydratase
MTKDNVEAAALQGGRYRMDTQMPPRFHQGDRVRAIAFNPRHHTRLPAYAKGKTGVVERHQGSFVFPDSNAQRRGEQPQHVYSVRFEARELWGEEHAGADAVYLDMWDSYLEPASG